MLKVFYFALFLTFSCMWWGLLFVSKVPEGFYFMPFYGINVTQIFPGLLIFSFALTAISLYYVTKDSHDQTQ